MNKRIAYISGAVIIALVLVIGIQQYQLYQTKQYSPEATIQYLSNDVRIEVFYNRPSKKGRNIFGDLVPFGKWWRTGANEPTTFTVSRDLQFNQEDVLKAGTYSVVTIPNEREWKLVFNANIPDWGTDYDPTQNVLETNMKVEPLPEEVEQFIIDFTENNGQAELIMAWDKTKVSIPFSVL